MPRIAHEHVAISVFGLRELAVQTQRMAALAE
jgi:hypothetical protein